jgi:hypothetical protein
MPLPARLEFFKRIMRGVHRGWLTSAEREARNRNAFQQMQMPEAQILQQQQMMYAAYAQAAAENQKRYPYGMVFGLGNLFGYDPCGWDRRR